ncbi:hypothetical protein CEXT_746821 [Caerostris extrusa]|uniref:C3H1-type domain-containing protein n=1 Tax=Caerostris extrusa TaxID=172846 RepID=A0AAV4XWF9_CAEEX|nr:hypothetical protein CEXT_746821 [Caerostris extrusa]
MKRIVRKQEKEVKSVVNEMQENAEDKQSIQMPSSIDSLSARGNACSLVQSDNIAHVKTFRAINRARYKTELCRTFRDTNCCSYGDRCQFAHGTHELRNFPKHPKYKTELCKNFHDSGFCPYGSRCQFIHSAQNNANPFFALLSSNLGEEQLPLTNVLQSESLLPVNPKRWKPSLSLFNPSEEKPISMPLFQNQREGLGSDGEASPPLSYCGSPADVKFFYDDDMNKQYSWPYYFNNSF